MSKVIFVGDPHLEDRTPVSRLDDIKDTTISKLQYILETALNYDVKTVVLTGDVFEKYEVSITYLARVLEVFREFETKGVEVYSIIGNHDLPHNNKRFFNQTPLSVLFQSGLVKHLTKLELKSGVLWGLDFTEKDQLNEIKQDITKYEYKTKILTMHYATDNTIPNESISREELQGFDIVVAGHDHMFYEPSFGLTPVVLRPGSMTRRTRDAYNLTRTPLMYLVDTDTGTMKPIEIKHQPAEEVFKTEVISGGISSFDPSTFSGVFNDAFFKSEAADLNTMIDNLPIDITNKTKTYLKDYFKNS